MADVADGFSEHFSQSQPAEGAPGTVVGPGSKLVEGGSVAAAEVLGASEAVAEQTVGFPLVLRCPRLALRAETRTTGMRTRARVMLTDVRDSVF